MKAVFFLGMQEPKPGVARTVNVPAEQQWSSALEHMSRLLQHGVIPPEGEKTDLITSERPSPLRPQFCE